MANETKPIHVTAAWSPIGSISGGRSRVVKDLPEAGDDTVEPEIDDAADHAPDRGQHEL